MTVVSGNPVVRYLPLSVNRELGIERGLWEITEGVIEDTETVEMFVVVSGRTTIEFLDEDNREGRAGARFGRLSQGRRADALDGPRDAPQSLPDSRELRLSRRVAPLRSEVCPRRAPGEAAGRSRNVISR